MALSISGFDAALDYRIVHQTAGSPTANENVTQSSGDLLSVAINNSTGTAACYVKIFDGTDPTPGTSIPQFVLRCPSAALQKYEIPEGFSFTNLNFWVTKLASPTDTTSPTVSSGGVGVTLITK